MLICDHGRDERSYMKMKIEEKNKVEEEEEEEVDVKKGYSIRLSLVYWRGNDSRRMLTML